MRFAEPWALFALVLVPLAVAAFFWAFKYFFLNFSTLPSVSMIFCLPVKKGWQAEQMSMWIVSFVESV